MKKKIFLTSAIAMGFVAPAFAAPSHTDAFPDDGLMQEDYTYENAATADNMDSVYEGTVNATAEYETLNYLLSAGMYLPADSETPTTCPVGSYCSGIGSVQYDEENDQGLTSCPTIGGTAFTSASGSSAVTACYQDSTKSSAELNPFNTAHLNTSKNTDGYINGVKYKSATTAARRYATTATTAGEWAALDESDLAITDLACENGYHYKAGTTAPNLTSLIGITEAAVDNGYKSNSGTGENYNEDKYGITQNGEFVVDYGSKGKIHGHAQCSTRSATDPWVGGNPWDGGAYVLQSDNTTTTLPDNSGHYCYCQLDSYTPEGGSATALSAPWVFRNVYDDGGADYCAYDCANECANALQDVIPGNLAFRAALFGSAGASAAICEANTITINWDDVDPEYAGQNNEGTATYGEDVRTPVKANTYKGKTFKGWKFSKPEQTTTGGSN